MQIVLISDIPQFEAVRSAYETVYAADPHAQVYRSWMWLRGWFEMAPDSWVVLGVRADAASPYVAFLPLIMRGPRIFGFRPIRLLHMGGRPLAWNTGFVCLPESEAQALMALATYVDRHIGWDSFLLEYTSDPRLDIFLGYFPAKNFEVKVEPSLPAVTIALPGSWEQYLRDCLGPSTRRNLTHDTRRIEHRNDMYLTQAQGGSIESDLEVLLTMWQWRWGPKPMAHWERRMLRHCFEHDTLRLTVLWHNTTPVAAVSGILDRPKKIFYAYMTAYDATYAKLSPGAVLLGYAIRWAIENGFHVFDLMLGADPYKLTFGAQSTPRGA